MTMNTGDVSRRIGVPITAELLRELGFTPTGKDKRAVLWDEDDYPAMCDALGRWIFGRKAMPMQPKPAAAPAKGKPKASKPAVDDDEEL